MEQNEQIKNNYLIPASILVAGIMISGAIIYGVRGGSAPDGANRLGAALPNVADTAGATQNLLPVKLSPQDALLGKAAAPVAFIEYADFQCPFCARFYNDVGKLVKKNYVDTGKVKMAYRNFAFLGPESLAASEALLCAKDQGKFWEYHDALFEAELKDAQENNGNLNRNLFTALASGVGMDANALGQCIDAKKYAALVEQARTESGSFGVNSTPTSFINGKIISGACPYAVFDQALQAELAGKAWGVDRCQFALR